MATYAIGDLQGCWLTLESLLTTIKFRPRQDKLWFVGDIVNRGQGSLECLRFVHGLGERAIVTLGNHDLHLLAVAEGLAKPHRLDTLDEILHAPDRDILLQWLRQQKLLHIEKNFAMVHAGLMPQWSWSLAASLCKEVETLLRSTAYRHVLKHMYGNEPNTWQPSLSGNARMRFVLNTVTRMRALTQTPAPAHDLAFKGSLQQMPSALTPWFAVPSVRRSSRTVIAGHWSALGLHQQDRFIGLDTGCIWGEALTAYRLDDGKIFQVASQEKSSHSVR
jgi:bis(5'-nucleosyl)-tetraphosphatase (symmetrical)